MSTSERTILVIDDSATIRRLVDSTLSPVGYRVVLAASAVEGIERATDIQPNLIILDHQLPGTTGTEVCRQLLESPDLKDIPVIASSTLRKRAYVEYADCPNVVDMLPKPYTAELLVTTVANTFDTGSLVVDSQRDGTAVPEVINDLEQAEMSGSFKTFTLREVLDFLNNGDKSGLLEVELTHNRVWIYLAKGRVQAITGGGIDPEIVTEYLPESLQDLAPVLKLTMGGGACSQVDGLVQLLDNKVLDPRLLQQLLRHQASLLLMHCFNSELNSYQFENGRSAPALHSRLPLDISVIGLLVEAASRMPADGLPELPKDCLFSRRAIRGQNLDRAGLSAQHQKIMSCLNDPISADDLAVRLQCEPDQMRKILTAFVMADLVETQKACHGGRVVVLETCTESAIALREAAKSLESEYMLKVVRDKLSLQLMMRRQPPDVLVLAVDSEIGQQVYRELREKSPSASMRWVGIHAEGQELSGQWDVVLYRPYDVETLFQSLDPLFEGNVASVCAAAN